MFNYNDIIEYEDCTWDENFNEALQWCRDNNAELVEDIERRKEVEYEVEEEQEVIENEEYVKKTVKVTKTKLMRYFQIVENPKPEIPEQIIEESEEDADL